MNAQVWFFCGRVGRILVLATALGLSGSATAQPAVRADLAQPARLELPGSERDQHCQVVPIAVDSSVVVYTEDTRRHEGDTQRHCFQAFDHQLRPRWKSYVHLPAGAVCQLLETNGPVACALFVTAREREVLVVRLSPTNGAAWVRHYVLPVPILPLAFAVRGSDAFVVAWAYRQQTVIRLPLRTTGPDSVAQFLPTLSASTTSVSDVVPDATGLTVLLAERQHELARLLVRPFDSAARPQLAPLPLQAPWPLSLTAGRLAPTTLPGAPRLVVGTYATRDVRYAQGIFSALLPADDGSNPGSSPPGVPPIRYYDLPTLPHYYDRLGPRRRARASARAVRRRRAGLETIARARLLLHRPLSVPDGGYVLIAEQYYPRFRAGDAWGYRAWGGGLRLQPFAYGVPGLYGPYDPLNVWDRGFDGYVYTQAIVMGFDATGQLRWQQSFVLGNVVRRELAEQVAAVVESGGVSSWHVALALSHGTGDLDEVRYGLVGPNQPSPALVLRASPRANDRARVYETSLTRVLAWRPGYLLACGYQRVGPPAGTRGPTREVFFVNSLAPALEATGSTAEETP